MAIAYDLCNNILARAFRDNIKVTPMKLQKLLYYVCVLCLKKTDLYPLEESFEVWKYGPVMPSVYAMFKPYRANPIKKYAIDINGDAWTVDEIKHPVITDCVETVWDRLKNYSGSQLARRTHQEGSGWYCAWERGDTIIAVEDMKNDATF